MALSKITYNDKVALNPQPSVANENKCTDNDLNQIKKATNGVVDMVKSNNLLIDKCFINAYITNTGAISSANNNALFGYIEVDPNTTYTMSVNATISSMMIGEYDSSKTWLQRPLGNNVSKLTITTSANTKYVRVAINKDNSTAMTQSIIDSLEPQFEKGGDRTAYMPYVNIKGQDIYSKGEIQIGTWIDGKPLYRKVVYISSLPNNTTGFYDIFSSSEIGNIDLCIMDDSASFMTVTASGITENDPMNWIYSTTAFVFTCIRNKQIRIITKDDKSSTSAYVSVKYTKTTD